MSSSLFILQGDDIQIIGSIDGCMNEDELPRFVKNGWLGEVLINNKNILITKVESTSGVVHVLCVEVSNYVKAIAELKSEYLLDELTKIPTRKALGEHVKKSLSDVKNNLYSLAIIYIDLDNFKKYNDIYGHAFGDEILKIAANRFKSCLRIGDFVSRVGGDEFVIVVTLPLVEDCESVTEGLIKRIFSSFSEEMIIDSKKADIFCSAGIFVVNSGESISLEKALSSADAAMLTAKGKGRSNYQYYHLINPIQVKGSSDYEIVMVTDTSYKCIDGTYIFKSSLHMKNESGIFEIDIDFLDASKDSVIICMPEAMSKNYNEEYDNLIIVKDLKILRFLISHKNKFPLNIVFTISEDIFIEESDVLSSVLSNIDKYSIFITGKGSINVILDQLRNVEHVVLDFEMLISNYGDDANDIISSIIDISALYNKKIVYVSNSSMPKFNLNKNCIYKRIENGLVDQFH